MSDGLNCRQGDLALVREPGMTCTCPICGVHRIVLKAGTPVICAALENFFGRPAWRIEEPIDQWVDFSCGTRILVTVISILDSRLMPVRDPGADAVDQMVELVRAPNATTLQPIDEVTPCL